MESSKHENREVISGEVSGKAEVDSIKARLGHGHSERTLLPTTMRWDDRIDVVSRELMEHV
jgi:hypothetical protein